MSKRWIGIRVRILVNDKDDLILFRQSSVSQRVGRSLFALIVGSDEELGHEHEEIDSLEKITRYNFFSASL